MNKPFSLNTVKVAAFITITLLFIYVILPKNNESKVSQEYLPYPLSIKGLSSEAKNENGTLISKIKAETIKIKPRKFFLFSIKSLNEALLTKVKVDYLCIRRSITEKIS